MYKFVELIRNRAGLTAHRAVIYSMPVLNRIIFITSSRQRNGSALRQSLSRVEVPFPTFF